MHEKKISSYPDISNILAAKTVRRQQLAALSWEEKVAIICKMQILLPKDKWGDRTTDNNNAESKP